MLLLVTKNTRLEARCRFFNNFRNLLSIHQQRRFGVVEEKNVLVFLLVVSVVATSENGLVLVWMVLCSELVGGRVPAMSPPPVVSESRVLQV